MQQKINKVGILGGGQLARMLAEAATTLQLFPVVLTENAHDPACATTAKVILGELDNIVALQDFFSNVDIVAIENEFLNCNLVRRALQAFPNLEIIPSLDVLEKVQNKLTQKKIFKQLNIPTAKYISITTNQENLNKWLEEVQQTFSGSAVLKWAQYGYDGKGNFFLKNKTDLPDAKDFCLQALSQNIAVYAEEVIAFEQECAMLYCHSRNGDFINYPLVLSEQERGICKLVFGPAEAFGIDQTQNAKVFGQILATALPLLGSFALEFFYSKKFGLLANELAPRVHNSGHYTLSATKTNQFINHWQAICAKPISLAQMAPFFAMLNLLGPENKKNIKAPKNFAASLANTKTPFDFYWYDKQELQPWRKLGHINCVAESKEKLYKNIQEMKQIEQKLWSSL